MRLIFLFVFFLLSGKGQRRARREGVKRKKEEEKEKEVEENQLAAEPTDFLRPLSPLPLIPSTFTPSPPPSFYPPLPARHHPLRLLPYHPTSPQLSSLHRSISNLLAPSRDLLGCSQGLSCSNQDPILSFVSCNPSAIKLRLLASIDYLPSCPSASLALPVLPPSPCLPILLKM